MRAVEFTVELTKDPVLPIPQDVAAQLPSTGTARVIILTSEDADDQEWRRGAYQQFSRDDSSEDSVYDTYR